jgi:hypothetical protein
MPGIHVFLSLWAKTWMAGTSGAKTRFALLPGHDGRREAVARFASRKDLLSGGMRLEWTFRPFDLKILRMGQFDQVRLCPHCGSPMLFALPPGGEGPRTLQCFECERPDPLKSDALQWLKGELQPPK